MELLVGLVFTLVKTSLQTAVPATLLLSLALLAVDLTGNLGN